MKKRGYYEEDDRDGKCSFIKTKKGWTLQLYFPPSKRKAKSILIDIILSLMDLKWKTAGEIARRIQRNNDVNAVKGWLERGCNFKKPYFKKKKIGKRIHYKIKEGSFQITIQKIDEIYKNKI